ncbi:hypothetical protein WOLCODRAFT_137708 [Wolfiporia cocos MD-104 SS10]|uniref:G domain-containing protein n=1 Tax=Wolfiporia cocos (strain MD-104) TaxID=742152 RepID=A0A2H3JKQ7_WOLCO|nr:hypothetical protein WOLCODRAFT_137708 [Wolfiporia cocos MD-104 SS10]
MGTTGCGKTQFVNTASGSQYEVGHNLASCTAHLQDAKFSIDDQPIALIDTPGFDDTEKPQTDVLKEIALFLRKSYTKRDKVDGVIYMHRISDNRMGGTALGTYRLFMKICGEEAMKNVMIVTNMWNNVEQPVGEAREEELRTRFFQDAVLHHARMSRHNDTRESAHQILKSMLANQAEVLRVQTEMVDENKTVLETGAGVELERELNALAEKHERAMKELLASMTAHAMADTAAAVAAEKEATKQELEKLQKKLEEIERERAKLPEVLAQEVIAKVIHIISDTFPPRTRRREPWWNKFRIRRARNDSSDKRGRV